MAILPGEQISTALTCLHYKGRYKSKLGTFFGGEAKRESPNRYDKLRAKLGELSAGEESIELDGRQERLVDKAAKFVLRYPNYAVSEHADKESEYQNILEGLGYPRTSTSTEIQAHANEYASQLMAAAQTLLTTISTQSPPPRT
jgi:hypothetical protein